MIKIIQLDSSSNLGGGQKILFEIVKGLKDKFDFLIIAPSGLFLEKYSQIGIKIQRLKVKNFIKIVKVLRNLIREEKLEILHFHGTRAAFWGRLAVIGLKNRPKIVYTLHGFHIIRRSFFGRWFFLTLEQFLNHWIDILVCVSEADRKLVLKHQTIAKDKIVVIKNGIDIEKFQVKTESAEVAREEMGLENNFVLTTIGRLHPPKDFSTILKALKLIASKNKKFRLLIVGDGPLRKSLEKETEVLGLSQYVKFLGFRSDIPILINLSDVVILSTKWEGLPLLPLEVGASKKPIIASNVDGVRETVIDGRTGYLFEPGSAKDLVDKILKLHNSKELRIKMGREGFEFVSKNFSKGKMIQKYRKLYSSLL